MLCKFISLCLLRYNHYFFVQIYRLYVFNEKFRALLINAGNFLLLYQKNEFFIKNNFYKFKFNQKPAVYLLFASTYNNSLWNLR